MTNLPNLSKAEYISLDIETRDTNLLTLGPGVRRDGYIIGISIGVPEGEQWYLPFHHEEGFNHEEQHIKQWALDNLCKEKQPKLGANLLYDLDYLYKWGVPVTGPFWDIQVAEPLINENQRRYSLDTLAKKYLGETKQEYEIEKYCFKHRLKGNAQQHLWRMPSELVENYAKEDVRLPIEIFKCQIRKLKQENLMDVFEIETKLIPILLAMRRRGVRVDSEHLEVVKQQLEADLAAAQQVICKYVPADINVGSTLQLASVFNKLDLPVQKTAKGNVSLTAEFLKTIEHPLPEAICSHRKYEKLLNTYTTPFPRNTINGRIHGLLHQLKGDKNGAATGRLSASHPNLQQIPKRDPKYGKLIRALFLPDTGEVWASQDYSQVELRLMVHYSHAFKEPSVMPLVDEFKRNPYTDLHQWCAEAAHVTRSEAKTINFGISYGMGLATLAKALGITKDEAGDFREHYFNKLPFIRALSSKATNLAAGRGYVMTTLRRRRRFDLWEPSDYDLTRKYWDEFKGANGQKANVNAFLAKEQVLGIKRAGTYRALNAVIQGSAADLMKKAMVDIWEAGVCNVLGAPLITVHDELDWSVPDTKEGWAALAEAKSLMTNAFNYAVPIIVDQETGLNWGDLKKTV